MRRKASPLLAPERLEDRVNPVSFETSGFWAGSNVLSVALGRLMEAGMLGVVSSDPRLLAGLTAVLVAASLAAAYVPARRAAALDPLDALRVE